MARVVPKKKKAVVSRTGIRFGFGYDAHPFVQGRALVLGGVTIPGARGLHGHSDADVLLHAICDALLGAASLGDIGRHFPNSDSRWKNISSLILLGRVRKILERAGFSTVNVDATVVLERPKIARHVPAMRREIAKALGITIEQVSVKATTNEGMGFIGRGEGCAAYAVASIEPLA